MNIYHRDDIPADLQKYFMDAPEIGLEQTPDEYVQKMVEVFREVKRVLRNDGCVFLNLGDSYASGKGTCFNPGGGDNSLGKDKKEAGAHPLNRGNKSTLSASGLKPKDLIGIPWRVAFALQADGWYLRQDIIWSKKNCMPESCTDRCTKSHEYVFLLTKSARYWMDMDAIRQKPTGRTDPIRSFNRGNIGNHTPNYQLDASVGANKRSVWTAKDDSAFLQWAIKNHPDIAKQFFDKSKGSVWPISTTPYRGCHFATMPTKLVEPMILAGCPAKCCPVCGAGWVRVVERTPMEVRTSAKGQMKFDQGLVTSTSGTMTKPPTSKTIGFQPSCQCNAPDHVPGTVCDPFGGSGTTAYVANAYGRNAILCELNPEYKPLILERLGMPYEVEQEERKPEQMELWQ